MLFRSGLLHISELADHKVDDPEEVVKVGDKIEVKILRVDPEDRKIGLSRKRVEWAQEEQAEAQAAQETPPTTKSRPPRELKGGVGSGSGPLIQPIASSQSKESDQTEQSAQAESSEQPAE